MIFTENKKEITKENRIKREQSRLKKFCKDVDLKKKGTVEGLIQRAAYLRITLEDFEVDLDENGFVEMFRQGESQEPYERKRPVADLYNTMNTSYQKAIKQLTDLIPKEEKLTAPGDDFDNFVEDREDI
ncbi:hypothetical protein [[Clostridium] symbiosum]|uniref:hypothetical protein n=1 Tax=Clostridium symbiosum TaxID=1512 RepID=UPI0020588052|nr:MAG TPA: hypothetical protein [Caudoviricetes sp.]